MFANTELNLGEIEVYGFDYDYTLATYRAAVEEFIYAEAKKALVYKFKVRSPVRGHQSTDLQVCTQHQVSADVCVAHGSAL